MSFKDEIDKGIQNVLSEPWVARDGLVVPASDDVTLKNGAVRLDATYLYADLADSSSLGQKFEAEDAARVVRAYLNVASRILKKHDGQIRSFDGDRVMAIFVGKSKNTSAMRAALQLNWAVRFVLKAQLVEMYPDIEDSWRVSHGVGIDTGDALLVRGGVRENNDLVSIGSAPNVAAKLSELRCAALHISAGVFNHSNNLAKTEPGQVKQLWNPHKEDVVVADKHFSVYWTNESLEP